MRRYPVGVAVVTVDVDGKRLGLTVVVARLARARAAARRDLDRAPGGVPRAAARGGRLRRLAARGRPAGARAALRARRPADRDVARASTSGRAIAARSSTAPSAGSSASSAASTTPATTRSSSAASSAPSPAPTSRRCCGSAATTARMIDAVVFDLDGVIVDSEQVWDDVREQLAKERGGRWHEGAQAAMMGMSSPEWSRTCTTRSGCPSRRRRSTPRSSSGCSSATASSCR